MRKYVLLLIAGLLLSSCSSKYSEFVLPQPPGKPVPDHDSYTWEVTRGPVVPRGGGGEWDSSDVLNPSVVRRGKTYYNFYSGFDGKTWHTGLAKSSDGLSWEKQPQPVLSPNPATWEGKYIAANGSAVDDDGEFLYWYQAGSPFQIGLARSSDGIAWKKNDKPVLEVGPRGSWDEGGAADPYVIQVGSYFYLYYTGIDRAHRQRLGVARSKSGEKWEKLQANPILELGNKDSWDGVGLGEPAVWAQDGYYWMLYTGRDNREYRKTGLARSTDGVNWERSGRTALLAGDEAWDSKIMCDPSVEVQKNGDIRVWFGGGNMAKPDEGLNGQIGHAVLKPTAKE